MKANIALENPDKTVAPFPVEVVTTLHWHPDPMQPGSLLFVYEGDYNSMVVTHWTTGVKVTSFTPEAGSVMNQTFDALRQLILSKGRHCVISAFDKLRDRPVMNRGPQ